MRITRASLRVCSAPTLGSIRAAELRDGDAIRRLLDAAGVRAPLDGAAFVLEVDGDVAAVAYVAIDPAATARSFRLVLLDSALVRSSAPDVEERMLGALDRWLLEAP